MATIRHEDGVLLVIPMLVIRSRLIADIGLSRQRPREFHSTKCRRSLTAAARQAWSLPIRSWLWISDQRT